MSGQKKNLALVYGNLPTVEEIDQFRLLAAEYEVTVISSESICGYLTQTSYFHDLTCMALPDHDDNTTYLPGLEKILSRFDVVVVKERLGVYAYQAVKSKWRHRFRLVVWVDNATAFPGEDIKLMRTVRQETNNAADAFIVQSEVVKQALLLEGVEEQRIFNFAPYVEARVTRSGKNRAKALATLGLGDTDFVVSHFGQIEWEESLFDRVHSIKLLGRSDPTLASRVKLVFCGIGSFSTELRDRLITLGLDRHAVYVAPSRQAFETVIAATDCIYYANNPARDRLEGEPYRLVMAMVHQIPVLAPRNPLVEEYIGKHRIDFCQGSADSVAKAIKKAATATALRHNVSHKNAATAKAKLTKNKVTAQMSEIFGTVCRQIPTVDITSLDHQVLQAEALVSTKQYLAAVDLIESILKVKDIPVHHRSNLLRLIGDCFTKLGDGDGGKNAYIQAIDLDPYAAKAYIGLGTVGLTKQIYDISVLHFQKAVSLAPEDEMANLGLGLSFQGMGENNEACRWVIKALECNPDNTVAIFTLVQLCQERNKYTEAEDALTHYTERHPQDHNMVYTLAGIKHKIGKNAEAEVLINSIIKIDPYDDRAQALAKQIRRAVTSSAESSNG
jgi:tetratricopeptide (TPR) repeat protein